MRLLLAYERFPEFDRNSGALRYFEIIRLLRAEGHEITFLARDANDRCYREALEGLGVACVCDAETRLSFSPRLFARFLAARAFEASLLPHYDIYNLYAPFVRRSLPACHCILDTVDIHYLRAEREAELYPSLRRLADRVRREELAALNDADSVWAVTEAEREILRALLPEATPLRILPNIHLIADRVPAFAERRGVVFLGGYRHTPNVDAVHYFMREILPTLRRLRPDLPVTIAGSGPPESVRVYASAMPGVTVTGFVPDHRELLLSHRVGMAPLRFGAGMKGKIGEYLACGLPCVTTPIGAEGMDLQDDKEILIADGPEDFAAALVRLVDTPALWGRLSQAGMAYLRGRYTPQAVAPALSEAIDMARIMPHASEEALSAAALQQHAARIRLGRYRGHLIDAAKQSRLNQMRLRLKFGLRRLSSRHNPAAH